MTAFRRRLAAAGVLRTPWLTLTVFLLTAVPSCVQAVVPAVLRDLERTPAGLHSQWWRSVTSMAVQDGGAAGTLSNLAFLLVIGTIAEQALTRPRWLALYLLPRLAAEFAGYAWQPTGAGNSGAVCGLAGALAVVMLRGALGPPGPRRLPGAAPYAQLLWAGALVATVIPVAGALIIAAAFPLAPLAAARRVPPFGAIAGAAVLACGAALAADQNIHGAALLAGALLAPALALPLAAAPPPVH